jgi:WD40 repeat protein
MVVDAKSGKPLKEFRASRGRFYCVAFSPDGQFQAAADGYPTRELGQRVGIWEMAGLREVRRIAERVDRIRCLAFSPDGRSLASGGQDGTVRIWEAATGKCQYSLPGHLAPVMNMAFRPNGEQLAVVIGEERPGGGLRDPGVILWDLKTRSEVHALKGQYTVAFSPDGERLATADQKEVIVYATATGKISFRLALHTKVITAVTFSPDGRQLVSVATDGTARLWDVAPPEEKPSVAAPK